MVSKVTVENLNQAGRVLDWIGLDRIEHFNAMETDYTWDAANRLTGIAYNGPTNLVSYSFMLDAKHLWLPDKKAFTVMFGLLSASPKPLLLSQL